MSTPPEPSWVEALRVQTRSPSAAAKGIEVFHGARPPWFDADAARALSSALLAAFIVAAAIFRTQVAPLPFDLLGLLLRTAALAFVLRAVMGLLRWAAKLARDARAPGHTLAWSEHGLYLRGPSGERFVAREDVLGVVLPEQRQSRALPPSPQPLLLVPRPQKIAEQWAIPPYFAGSPEILEARLTRWLGTNARAPAKPTSPPEASPEERYRRAARGQLEAGEAVVPEGTGFRLRAPYTALLGVAFALDALRVAGPLRARLIPAVTAACLLALGTVAAWLWWMEQKRKTRLGIALLLTPEELLVRGRAGVVSVPWAQLSQHEVTSRLAWSPFVGSYLVRVFVLTTLEGDRMLFDGSFLGIAPEALGLLCEAYRRGVQGTTKAREPGF